MPKVTETGHQTQERPWGECRRGWEWPKEGKEADKEGEEGTRLALCPRVGGARGCSFLLSYLALAFCSRNQLPFPGKCGRGVSAWLVSPENGLEQLGLFVAGVCMLVCAFQCVGVCLRAYVFCNID